MPSFNIENLKSLQNLGLLEESIEEIICDYIYNNCYIRDLIFDYHEYSEYITEKIKSKNNTNKNIGIELELNSLDQIEILELAIDGSICVNDETYGVEKLCNVFASYDGSLNNMGAEFVTEPAEPQTALLAIENVLYNLSWSDSINCGLHFHLDSNLDGDSWFKDLNHLKTFICLFSRWYKFFSKITGRGWESLDEWARNPFEDGDEIAEYFQDFGYDEFESWTTHNMAIDLRDNTVEVRIFDSSEYYNQICEKWELLQYFIGYTAELDEETVMKILTDKNYSNSELYMFALSIPVMIQKVSYSHKIEKKSICTMHLKVFEKMEDRITPYIFLDSEEVL